MKISIGSKNPSKIGAVKSIFACDEVISMNVPSQVSNQPFSDSETKEGAIHRATGSLTASSSDIGIGLEGGVMNVDDKLYLCNWGALVTRDDIIFTGSGARVLLPEKIGAELQKGIELGDVMDDYAHKKHIRKKEGAIGILTNNQVSRKEMFIHVVKLLYGQWEYWKQN
ncbi:NTPase [Lentibacillus kapialis]|uniref:inosine/xanthosine triphosphatase n=1 Tax=Lentibacillus kapialis TaxID=340214 RepID=A0A917Q3D3_9BACI|nr:DUF84 family protein [Lentibacillus kapialis]GGK06657.1 NTPase [Lentibacillus kapialis]